MNTLIIYEQDAQIAGHLVPLARLGKGVVDAQGRQVMLHGITETRTSKGMVYGDAQEIYEAVRVFADTVLAAAAREAMMQLVLIFHQSSRVVVDHLGNGMKLVEWTRILKQLSDRHKKPLLVKQVVLLSCETAIDKVVHPPLSRVIQFYADQAAEMRRRAATAFRTLNAPPYPSQGFHGPAIVTFSTGNADRGGLVLDPFAVQFRDLAGRFDDNGAWTWDDPRYPDRDGVETAGTVYVDDPETGETTSAEVPAGGCYRVLDFGLG